MVQRSKFFKISKQYNKKFGVLFPYYSACIPNIFDTYCIYITIVYIIYWQKFKGYHIINICSTIQGE